MSMSPEQIARNLRKDEPPEMGFFARYLERRRKRKSGPVGLLPDERELVEAAMMQLIEARDHALTPEEVRVALTKASNRIAELIYSRG